MRITHEDFQRARRISRAIQDYLEATGHEGVRSTDIYPYLAKKGLIQKDRHNGLHLRRFLIKLKENNLLNLISQCTCNPGLENQFNEWYFYKADLKNHKIEVHSNLIDTAPILIVPDTSEEEIEELLSKAKPFVARLPKRDVNNLNALQKETRINYPRAYEFWTDKEIEIMKRAYKKFQRVDKVAELLERQPSMVESKLIELKVIDRLNSSLVKNKR